VYLCVAGGKECIKSKEVLVCALEIAGRCLTSASHKINSRYITDITDTTDPTLATTFQHKNVSGKSEYRRGIPARPKKCIGKKVRFTPRNIVKN